MKYRIDYKGFLIGGLIAILNIIPILITTIIRVIGLFILCLLVLLHIIKNRNNIINWLLTGETTINPINTKFMLWLKKIMEQ